MNVLHIRCFALRCVLMFTVTGLSLSAPAQITFQKVFGGSGYDVGNDILQLADGSYLIAAQTNNYGAGATDGLLIKCDSNGNVLWAKAYGGPLQEGFGAIAPVPDGGFVLTGSMRSFGSGEGDVWLIRCDDNGDTLWSRAYGGVNGETANSVASTQDGGCIVVGGTTTFGGGGGFFWDYYIIKVDSLGNLQWTKTIDAGGDEIASKVLQTTYGEYIVVGSAAADVFIAKMDAFGNVQWTKTFGDVDWMVWDAGADIRQTIDKGFIIEVRISNVTHVNSYNSSSAA